MSFTTSNNNQFPRENNGQEFRDDSARSQAVDGEYGASQRYGEHNLAHIEQQGLGGANQRLEEHNRPELWDEDAPGGEYSHNQHREEKNRAELRDDGTRQATGGEAYGMSQAYRTAPVISESGPGGFGQDHTRKHHSTAHGTNPAYTDNVNNSTLDQGSAPATSRGDLDHEHSGGGTGQRIVGKVEAAIGSAIGSQSLQAKGLKKQNELQNAEVRRAAHGGPSDDLLLHGPQGGFQGQSLHKDARDSEFSG